jgi:hypothetical protein
MPFGHQYALDLAQHGMRIRSELEHVRQQHEIDAAASRAAPR